MSRVKTCPKTLDASSSLYVLPNVFLHSYFYRKSRWTDSTNQRWREGRGISVECQWWPLDKNRRCSRWIKPTNFQKCNIWRKGEATSSEMRYNHLRFTRVVINVSWLPPRSTTMFSPLTWTKAGHLWSCLTMCQMTPGWQRTTFYRRMILAQCSLTRLPILS